MYVLGLDFETTGLDESKDRVIEVGAILYDTVRNMPIQVLNELILPEPEGLKELSPEVRAITGLTPEIVTEWGLGMCQIKHKFTSLIMAAEHVVAHNAPFEEGFLRRELIRVSPEYIGLLNEIQWIDTRTDLPLKAYQKGRSSSLTYLAADHGFLNPFPHRAFSDVLTMMKLFMEYPTSVIVERSKSPTLEIEAVVDFHQKDFAKEAGFHWDGERKKWVRNIKECDLEELSKPWRFIFNQRKITG